MLQSLVQSRVYAALKLFSLFFLSLNLLMGAKSLAAGSSLRSGLQPKFQFVPQFSSFEGRERAVHFEHVFKSQMRSLEEVEALSPSQRQSFVTYRILPLMKYLFGPLTNREWGGPQKNDMVVVQWSQAQLQDGRVLLPYEYKGVWILDKELSAQDHLTLPVPLNSDDLFTDHWKDCGDSAPEHQTASFFWYFWDPERSACDHKEGVQYRNVDVQFGIETENQSRTYPEYSRMIVEQDGQMQLAFTVAFGYVNDPASPNPERDADPGMFQYRYFLAAMRAKLAGFADQPVLAKEYGRTQYPELVIGHRLIGEMKGVQVQLTIVTAAAVDQMYLFAKSFAHDHEAAFAWMGHSRVGGGFDAATFRSIMAANPNYYSISDRYQLVYWGGCNSYSYYTLPFFSFKAEASAGADPQGTKNLDILSHGLPSFFSLNSANAEIFTSAILNWESGTSYQSIVRELELRGNRMGANLLAVVLGDEDNPR